MGVVRGLKMGMVRRDELGRYGGVVGKNKDVRGKILREGIEGNNVRVGRGI